MCMLYEMLLFKRFSLTNQSYVTSDTHENDQNDLAHTVDLLIIRRGEVICKLTCLTKKIKSRR
jgi:hypothetical protein